MKGGELTPLYELVVAMLTRGERRVDENIKAIFYIDDWQMVRFPGTDVIDLWHPDVMGFIHMDSALGRAILAAW